MSAVKLIKGTRYWAVFDDGVREAVFVGKDANGIIALAVVHEHGALKVTAVDGTDHCDSFEFRVVQPENQALLRDCAATQPPPVSLRFQCEPDFAVLKQMLYTADALPVHSSGGYIFSDLRDPIEVDACEHSTVGLEAGCLDLAVPEEQQIQKSPRVSCGAEAGQVLPTSGVECHNLASDSDDERPSFPRIGHRVTVAAPSHCGEPVSDPLREPTTDGATESKPKPEVDKPLPPAEPVPVRGIWSRGDEGGANPQCPEPDWRQTTDLSERSGLDGRILLENKSRAQVKACLYRGNDVLQWVPYGGVRGSGVRFIDPQEASAFEVPAGEYCVKIFRPGVIDVPLFTLNANPGASIIFTGEPSTDSDRGAVATTAMVAGATGLLLAGPVVAVGAVGSAVYVGTRQDGAGAALRAVGKVGTAVGSGVASFAQRWRNR